MRHSPASAFVAVGAASAALLGATVKTCQHENLSKKRREIFKKETHEEEQAQVLLQHLQLSQPHSPGVQEHLEPSLFIDCWRVSKTGLNTKKKSSHSPGTTTRGRLGVLAVAFVAVGTASAALLRASAVVTKVRNV